MSGFGPAQGTFGGSATFTSLTVTGTATFASTVTVTTSISSPLYTSAANAAIAVSPGDNASATDTVGGDLNLRSGKGRGAGAASSIVFQTPTVGSTGTTLQTLATRLTVATAGITATVPVLLPDGSAGTPSLSFTNDSDSGFLSYGGGNAAYSANGGATVGLMTTGITLPASLSLRWSSSGSVLSSDLILSRHSAANLRQGAAAANDADGAAQTLRAPSGGTVSSGTTGKNGGAYTITAGAGSDAKAASNANGGNGGLLTLTGGAKGLKDGGGSDGLDGGVQVSRSGGLLGFYGVSPIARAVLATGTGATVDNVITALQNLGLVSQS